MSNQSCNGWSNIGICYLYALKNISHKYIATYMAIVRYSFGYSQHTTNRNTTKWWSQELGISEKSFRNHLEWLSDNKHIKIIKQAVFISGGGSSPNAYAPVFPKGFGNIHFKETKKSVIKKELEI